MTLSRRARIIKLTREVDELREYLKLPLNLLEKSITKRKIETRLAEIKVLESNRTIVDMFGHTIEESMRELLGIDGDTKVATIETSWPEHKIAEMDDNGNFLVYTIRFQELCMKLNEVTFKLRCHYRKDKNILYYQEGSAKWSY